MRGALVLVAVVALAGCVGLAPADELEGGIGEVDGITADSNISVDGSDGFNETERELLVKRSMARVEVVRGLRFERPVDVEVQTREQYRSERGNRSVGETTRQWNNQVWEGLFLVGEDRDVYDVFDATLGSAVAGFYEPGEDRLVIVSDDETPTIAKDTLVHELTHALQDQQFGIGDQPPTQDRQLAWRGVVEGEAQLVPAQYRERCRTEWSCIRPETAPPPSADSDVDRGVLAVIIHPYRTGGAFVEQQYDDGGWEAVDVLHEHYPESTEQLLYPERYPGDNPENVTVDDRSSDGWERFDRDTVGDTLGQASITVMLAENGIIDAQYRHSATDGWAGDQLVPYHRGETGDVGDGAYVWETRWDTDADAREFDEAYRDLLERHDATTVEDGVYRVPEGPFADAFRVNRTGRTVRVVNAPTVDELDAVHRE